jgi:HEAT repeat protein
MNDDDYIVVRHGSAVALGQLGNDNPAVLDALIKRMNDDNDIDVRRAAAKAALSLWEKRFL